MYLCQRDVMVRREQCQDLLRRAEQARIARLVLSTVRATRYRKALCALGSWLHAWGQRLIDLGTIPTYGERVT